MDPSPSTPTVLRLRVLVIILAYVVLVNKTKAFYVLGKQSPNWPIQPSSHKHHTSCRFHRNLNIRVHCSVFDSGGIYVFFQTLTLSALKTLIILSAIWNTQLWHRILILRCWLLSACKLAHISHPSATNTFLYYPHLWLLPLHSARFRTFWIPLVFLCLAYCTAAETLRSFCVERNCLIFFLSQWYLQLMEPQVAFISWLLWIIVFHGTWGSKYLFQVLICLLCVVLQFLCWGTAILFSWLPHQCTVEPTLSKGPLSSTSTMAPLTLSYLL